MAIKMKAKIIYSQKILTIFKIISIFAIIILLAADISILYYTDLNTISKTPTKIFTLIINTTSIILFTVIIFHPEKIGITSIICFLYSSYILFKEPENNIGLLFYFLTFFSSQTRGFFVNKKKLKLCLIWMYLGILILTELRFGINIFLKCFLDKIAYTFIFLLSILFSNSFITEQISKLYGEKILDIRLYKELTVRDARWLSKLQAGDKYEKIAIDEHLSTGSVKNRFKIIFNELCVGDKQGFINTYSNFEIKYGEQFSSKDI